MVYGKLQNIHQSWSAETVRLSKEIKELKIISLKKIKSDQKIKTIYNDIISAVDKLLIVHIDEGELSIMKPRKAGVSPILHTDDERWINGSIIREDWTRKKWQNQSLKWWIWFDTDESILGCLYYKFNEKGYEVFIKNVIADHPQGAMFLVQEMKKKLNKHILKK